MGQKMQPQSAQKRCAETVHNHNCGTYFDALCRWGSPLRPWGPPRWPHGPKNSILNDLGSSWENPGEAQNPPKCVPGAPPGGTLEEKVASRKRGSRVDASILLRLGEPPGPSKEHPWMHFIAFWRLPSFRRVFASRPLKNVKNTVSQRSGRARTHAIFNFLGCDCASSHTKTRFSSIFHRFCSFLGTPGGTISDVFASPCSTLL